MTLPRIAITPGEPAGIGPDIILQMAQLPRQDAELVVIADPALLQQRAQQLGLPINLQPFDPSCAPTPLPAAQLRVLPIEMSAPCKAGVLDKDNAHYVLATLNAAISACVDGVFDAMVTAPVHKGIINDAGISFSGHTEFLAEKTNCAQVVMMLATEGLRVALVTTHLPLTAVAAQIKSPHIEKVIRIVQHDMQKYYGLTTPRISVLGLNPHAGEMGYMGREEIDHIIPAMSKLKEQGFLLDGPLPADTAFTQKHLDNCDVVLAMYHDQGLPVLKYKGFGRAVNITLGLPIIRTSVDHGTALDLAGSGGADIGSLQYAVDTAITMAKHTMADKNAEGAGADA